mgnify:CR=1 FL=1
MYNTISGVSLALEESAQLLTYLEKIRSRLYVEYYIKKHNGGKREINCYLYQSEHARDFEDSLIEYSKVLKRVHTKINNRIFKEIEIPNSVYGFISSRSAALAAKQHVGKPYMISLDLHNFFGTVQSDWVLDSLKKLGFGSDAAWLIARLVAYKGHLPQGAVTSPMASNIAFMDIDKQIEQLCAEHGITYTRYADDLTFSGDYEMKDFVLNDIANIIKSNGYIINEKKTKIYSPQDVHYVLGYVVNRKLNVLKDKRRNLEAAIYNFVVKHQMPYGVEPMTYKRSLLGKANYMLNANPQLGRLAKRRDLLKEFDPNKYEFEKIVVDNN